MLENNALIIHWQVNTNRDGEIWSQISAKGDERCQQIYFNKKTQFRPLWVEVEDSIDFYAYFSPLDTKDLIQSLANRSKFSLCNFDFSLKGSQAQLESIEKYYRILHE